MPPPSGSRTVLAFGMLATDATGADFVMPAHALCIVTGVLAGTIHIENDRSSWQPLPPWSIQGPQMLARRWRADPGTRVVSILLHAYVIAERLGQPARCFRDGWLPAGDHAGLLAAIGDGTNSSATRGTQRDARRRVRAMAALAQARSVPIAATSLGISERALQRLCDRDLGLPPVVLLRLMRMHRCAAQGLAHGRLTADDALAAGYGDQAHMARDFRLLAGIRPRHLTTTDGWPMRESAARLVPAWEDGVSTKVSDSSKT